MRWYHTILKKELDTNRLHQPNVVATWRQQSSMVLNLLVMMKIHSLEVEVVYQEERMYNTQAKRNLT